MARRIGSAQIAAVFQWFAIDVYVLKWGGRRGIYTTPAARTAQRARSNATPRCVNALLPVAFLALVPAVGQAE